MVRRYVALLLVLTLTVFCSPVLAGDLVSPKLLPPVAPMHVRAGLPLQATALSLPQSAQPTTSQPVQPTREWTKGGKIMTVIGAGLVGVGAFMMTRENSTLTSSCNSSSCTETQINWKATGGITAGGGAALLIIGKTRRH